MVQWQTAGRAPDVGATPTLFDSTTEEAQVQVPRPASPSGSPATERVVAFARDLDRFGSAPALVTPQTTISYEDLSARVTHVRTQLSGERRLVLLRGSNTVETIVGYLAALSAGHVVVIAPNDKPTSWPRDAGYDPDIVVSGADVEVLRATPRYVLHPDLALLLSTSGSTGSGKLVRLSQQNLEANAESIADYLGITPADRAVTTLPMHYCYGLSVIHSYLTRGASLLLTDGSVADPGFWDVARDLRVTSFAGVPHTFELLSLTGFEGIDLPDLRYATQAGGRMAPERVRQFAELGRRNGWDLVVMYGQTEATARMAYLPPDLVLEHTGAVGVAIPGGSFRIDPIDDWPDRDAGELCYSGPNVMLGYAQDPSDLALGRVVHELRTGDIARIDDAGLVEIVGRRSRFLKLFGLRIDLQQTEDLLARHGWTTVCSGDDDALQVAVVGHADSEAIQALIVAELGLPRHVVQVIEVPSVPRLDTGKVDYVTLRELFPRDAAVRDSAPSHRADPADLRALYATLLNRPDAAPDDTFVSLGGDSLSYVETTVRLEQALGAIPPNWHLTPIRELQGMAQQADGRPRRRTTRVETSVALRALAIVVIVANHAGFWDRLTERLHLPVEFDAWGGAYALLAIAGFNLARFSLSRSDRRARLRSITGSLARLLTITLPVLAVVTLAGVVTVRGLFDPHYVWHVGWLDEVPQIHREPEFWFITLLIVIDLAVLAFVAIPWVHRQSIRFPFFLPLGLMALDVALHYLMDTSADDLMPVNLVWLFLLGWATAEARHAWQRALLTAFVVVAMVLGLPALGSQTAYGAAILVTLIWFPWLPSTPLLNRLLGWIGASTLAIYLTHFQVIQVMYGAPYQFLWSRPLQIVVAVVLGVAYFKGAEWVIARVTQRWRTSRSRRAQRPAPSPRPAPAPGVPAPRP